MKTRSQKSKLILKLFLFINLLSLAAACGNKDSENNQDKKGKEQINFQPGKVTDKISCSQNPAYNYAIYLPSYYNPNKTYPAIIVFDAHARGKMAASRFAKAAEKFGYIVFASNNAKNGLKEIDEVVNALFTDVFAFQGIDKKRLYTAGFSGGARVASSAAIYKGGIKGVIACAGGMPETGQKLSGKFDFAGVVGLNDFNYHEMKTLDKALSANGFTCQLFTFNGTHEWPSPDVLSNAVEWLDLMAMKKKEIQLNDNLVRNYLTSYSDSINRCIVSGLNYQAYLLYKIFLKDLDGLYDISDFQKSYDALLKNPEIDKNIKAEEKITKDELAKQESLMNLFKSGNYSALKNETSILLKNSSAKNEISVHSSKRLLSFVGMLCYMYTENAVNSQNKTAFSNLIEIYALVEPKNPDKEFYKACQAMMDNLPDKAFEYLQKALEYGYYDADRLQIIGYFEQIRTKPEFDQIIKKAMENFDKQN